MNGLDRYLLPGSPEATQLYSLRELISRVNLDYFPWPIRISEECGQVKVSCDIKDRDNGERKELIFRSLGILGFFPIDLPYEERRYTMGDGLALIYSTVRDFVNHELDEAFKFMGLRVFDPHEADGRDIKDRLVNHHDRYRYRGPGL